MRFDHRTHGGRPAFQKKHLGVQCHQGLTNAPATPDLGSWSHVTPYNLEPRLIPSLYPGTVLALVGWVRYRPSWTLEHLASWRPSHKFPSNSHLNSNNHPVEKAPAYSPVLAPAYPNIFPNLHYLGLLPRPKIKARTHTL